MATKHVFRRLQKTPGDVKLAPQELVLFNTIPATKAGIERADLIAALEEQTKGDDPALKTRQSVSIILGYYRKHLIETGLIEHEKIVEEAPKKVKAKAEPEPAGEANAA